MISITEFLTRPLNEVKQVNVYLCECVCCYYTVHSQQKHNHIIKIYNIRYIEAATVRLSRQSNLIVVLF